MVKLLIAVTLAWVGFWLMPEGSWMDRQGAGSALILCGIFYTEWIKEGPQ